MLLLNVLFIFYALIYVNSAFSALALLVVCREQWNTSGLLKTTLKLTHSLSISMAIFPGGPGLASTRMSPFWILLELRMMEVVSGDN